MLDQVRDCQPEAARAQGARDPEKDEAVTLEHLLPDAVRGREVAPLKGDALHPVEQFRGCQVRIHGEGLDRRLKEARLIGHGRASF